MFLRCLALIPLLLGLASCGGEEPEASNPSYTDASGAIDAANSAMAAGDYAKAEAAYRFAIDQAPNADYQGQWSMDLFKALVLAGKSAEAMEAMNGLAAENPEQVTGKGLQGLADFCIGEAKSAKMASYVLSLAKDGLAEDQRASFDFEKVASAVTALESGDNAALAQLGYVGD